MPAVLREDGTIEERRISMEENCGGWSLILRRDPDTVREVYLRGANRMFIDMEDTELEIDLNEGKNMNQDQVIIFYDFMIADPVMDYNFLREKAVKNKVDIRIFVWQEGMNHSQVTTWYRDGKTEEETRKFANWLWDSPMPHYGG